MQIKTGIYKHFKGGLSFVVCVAESSEDGVEPCVVYKGLQDGKFHARPVSSFCEMVVDKLGNKVPRFTLVEERSISFDEGYTSSK